MRHKIIRIIIILATLGLLIVITQPCYANPLPIDPNYVPVKRPNPYILWAICPLIEAGIIVFTVWRRFTSQGSRVWLFISVVFLNIVTLPFTWQIGNQLMLMRNSSGQHNPDLVYLAEAFPLVVEFLILMVIFYFFRNGRSLSEPVSPGFVVFLTLVANVMTFALGFAFYYYFPSMFNAMPS